MERRVVIIGMGIRTYIGTTLDEVRQLRMSEQTGNYINYDFK